MKITRNKEVLMYTLIVIFFVMIYVVTFISIFGTGKDEGVTWVWINWRMIPNLIAFFTIAVGSKHLTWWILDKLEGRKA